MPWSYIGAFVLALVLSASLMPLAARLGFRLGAVSRPGGRNVNALETPRFGGPAIFVAFVLPLTALFFLESSVANVLKQNPTRVFGLFAGAALMLTLGIFDDVRGVRARTKLGAQLVAALVAYRCGFRIDVVSLPLFGDVALGVWALPLTALWVVGVVNAINLIDGLDGLAGGIVFCAAVTNFVVAHLQESVLVAALMVTLLGAVLGFLFHNFNPARIFMGDSGSYFLGFVLSLTAIAGPFQKASVTVSLLGPIVALGVPIVDTLFAMLRRVLERRSIFSPDRGHIHHRLLDLGLTQRRAVLVIYAASVLLTVAAVAISLGRDSTVGFAIMLATVVIVGLMRMTGMPRR